MPEYDLKASFFVIVMTLKQNKLSTTALEKASFVRKNIKLNKFNLWTRTFGRIIFDGLFKGCDVTECAQKQDHFLLFVPNGSNLHKKPNRRP